MLKWLNVLISANYVYFFYCILIINIFYESCVFIAYDINIREVVASKCHIFTHWHSFCQQAFVKQAYKIIL